MWLPMWLPGDGNTSHLFTVPIPPICLAHGPNVASWQQSASDGPAPGTCRAVWRGFQGGTGIKSEGGPGNPPNQLLGAVLPLQEPSAAWSPSTLDPGVNYLGAHLAALADCYVRRVRNLQQ
ncbi:unnamed protein product [Clonostachys byssicola]|uniref:Uncharacterized protein n=1 Tax=Clonostachys byssicola TaxID=160290 RepID=A0A9N9Y070_9HYPO|nr:unnamed protein product [Clonostachys byssicola]